MNSNKNFKNPIIIGGIILIGLIYLIFVVGQQNILSKLLFLPGIIIGITFHEAAHGFVSHWLGDPTPKSQGRLTLNPMAHIDPIGFFALLIAGFGWGKPVIIDPRYYKHPKRDEILVSLAGVTTNLIIGLIFAAIQVVLLGKGFVLSGDPTSKYLMTIINSTIFVNLVLMCFNLLPIPPLDGFSIITHVFNLRQYDWYYGIYRNGFPILMLLVFFGTLDGFLDKSVRFFYYNIVSSLLQIL